MSKPVIVVTRAVVLTVNGPGMEAIEITPEARGPITIFQAKNAIVVPRAALQQVEAEPDFSEAPEAAKKRGDVQGAVLETIAARGPAFEPHTVASIAFILKRRPTQVAAAIKGLLRKDRIEPDRNGYRVMVPAQPRLPERSAAE